TVEYVLAGLVDGEKESRLSVDGARRIGREIADIRPANDIVESGAGHLENVIEPVALGESAMLRCLSQVDGYRRVGKRIVDRVVVEYFEKEMPSCRVGTYEVEDFIAVRVLVNHSTLDDPVIRLIGFAERSREECDREDWEPLLLECHRSTTVDEE